MMRDGGGSSAPPPPAKRVALVCLDCRRGLVLPERAGAEEASALAAVASVLLAAAAPTQDHNIVTVTLTEMNP